MNINLEQTILRNLLTNEEYTRRVLPFLVPDYFDGVYKDLFKEVAKFVSKYNKIPTLESFKIEIDESVNSVKRIIDKVWNSYRISLHLSPRT